MPRGIQIGQWLAIATFSLLLKYPFKLNTAMTHERAIYHISDEDLIYAGFDPDSITPEEFNAICEKVSEYFDVSFSEVLKDAINTIAENAKTL